MASTNSLAFQFKLLASDLVALTINWVKYFQFKKGVCDFFFVFGKEVSHDRPEFYFTCARFRIYNQHMEHKSYCLGAWTHKTLI